MSDTWRKMRQSYIMTHPLCEVCLADGRTTPAEDVHHKETFVNKQNWQEYAYNSNNLVSVCKHCHGLIHTQKITI